MKPIKNNTVYRPVPSPCYEVEACESWLADMADQGLFVEKMGRMFARFRRGTPRAVRYRLTAARLKGSWLDSVPSEPLSAEKALYTEYGWYFVCAQEEFFLYACEDPRAPELHTDPAVQALSLKMARRSAWSEVFGALVALIAQFALNGRGHLVQFLVEMPVIFCCLCLYFLGCLFLAVRDLYHILKLSRRLHQGYAPDHRKDWRPAAWVHRISQGITAGALVLLGLGCVVFLIQSPSRQPITDYRGSLPFATLPDLADGTPVRDDDPDHNTLEIRHSLLAPTILEYEERGKILQDGQVVLDTPLQVLYYDTCSPWLARLLVRDLRENQALLADTPQPLSALPGLDAAYAYGNVDGVFRHLILVRGCHVLSVLWVDPDGTQDFDRLAPRFAEVFAAA